MDNSIKPKEAQVVTMSNKLEDAIQTIHEFCSQLDAKLEYVMTPLVLEVESVNPTNKKPEDNSSMSELAYRLKGHLDDLQTIKNILCSIIKRLDI